MNVAVIGGGYAGMAAAVTLAEGSVPVTVYEAGRALGGRARRIEHPALAAGSWLDNGLHILIGAYTETLRLMRLVGADPDRDLLRLPFTWNVHERLSLKAARLPAPLHLLAGLLFARGLSAARARWPSRGFMLAHAPGRLPLAARHERRRVSSRRSGRAPSPCASSGSRFACPRSTRRPPRHRRRYS